MNQVWEMIKLGTLLKPSVHTETPDPSKKYRQMGVKWWGEGVYERETISGNETSYPSFTKLEIDDLIYNKIWARHGSVSVVQAGLEGCYASTEFPVYKIDRERVLPDWIHWQTKCRSFWEKCAEKAFGTSGKNRIKPSEFLLLEIPLPPLSEQQRIAGWLTALKGKIDVVRALMGEQVREVERIAENAFDFIIPNAEFELKKIGEVATFKTGKTPPTSHPHYFDGDLDWYCPSDINNQLDCYLQGANKKISQNALDDNKATWYEPETILLISIGGTIGKVGILKKAASSNQQITGIKFNDTVLPEYGCYWLKKSKAEIINRAAQATLPIINQKKIAEINIAIPPLPEQRRIVSEIQAFHTKMDALKAARAGQLSALEGLFPGVLEQAFKGEW